MSKQARKNPKYYDGIRHTSHQVRDILPKILSEINAKQKTQPNTLIAAWPTIVGPTIAPMTRALSFREGVLTVAVKNATLHSLMTEREKGKILQRIRATFPQIEINNIAFRIG